ncbi:ribonucleotide-diphosphate reductase subunit beta [Sinobaca sp. H24]|uniref:ribonucleotide-diphosphate reductase subunit beta n=1 Tax=Sinobaca sp. H24 TaxID=2923376 RepID=UPI002097B1EB|nr:ribonucleotide-diphosphate reductase subunit beta [Sinobaca sp. H24]
MNTEGFADFVKETFIEAAELEIKWGNYVIGNKIDGINANELESYIKFMANKRIKELGFDPVFEGYNKNPMRWVSVYNDNTTGKADFSKQQ